VSLDARLRSRVAALTARVGAPITISRKTLSAGPNPAVAGTRRQTVTARISAFPARDVDGTLIKSSDILLIVPALNLTFAPEPRDQVTFNGELFEVISVQPEYVSTSVALYRVQAR
jgi:hypothetical protein